MSGAKFKKPTNTAEEDVLVAELRQLLSPGGSALVDEQLKQGGENGLDALTLRRWAVARKWDIAHAAKDLAAHAVYRSQNILGGRVTQVGFSKAGSHGFRASVNDECRVPTADLTAACRRHTRT